MIKELLQQLVETEDKMERLAILEEHPELMEEPTTETAGEVEAGEDYKSKYEELQAKYIARFFGKDEEPKETEKKSDAKPQTIDDLKL